MVFGEFIRPAVISFTLADDIRDRIERGDRRPTE